MLRCRRPALSRDSRDSQPRSLALIFRPRRIALPVTDSLNMWTFVFHVPPLWFSKIFTVYPACVAHQLDRRLGDLECIPAIGAGPDDIERTIPSVELDP
jgi:hypothetical protein